MTTNITGLRKFALSPLTLLIATGLSPIAQAQESDSDAIETVTVTAQKRVQTIAEVPVTMDVISADFLERTNTFELDDLSRVLPNVVVQEQAVSLPSFNIRGITDDSSDISATPRISVYQDGFDISKKTLSSSALYDIARVEVLKGPQPTLFGVAAANGAISIISNTPSEELDYNAQLGLNSEQGVELRAMLNTPINDNHSFRVAGLYREMDGIVKNQACGPDSFNPSGVLVNQEGNTVSCAGDNQLGGTSVQAIRATLKSTYDNFEIITRASMEYNDQPGISFKSGSIAPNGGDTSPYSTAELSLGSLIGVERLLTAFDITANVDITEDLVFTADAAYKDVELEEYFDADGSALILQDAYFENDSTHTSVSARLVYDSGERFAGFVGASYNNDNANLPYIEMHDLYQRSVFDAKLAELTALYPDRPLSTNVATDASVAELEAVRAELVAVLFNADGTPITNPEGTTIFLNGPYIFESEFDIISFVAEGSYDLTDDINITFGLRHIDETRWDRNNYVPFALDLDHEEEFSATLPRFAVNYFVNEDWNVYFNYAQGRRSPVVDADIQSFTQEETVDSYDLGVKYTGGNMLFTAAIFNYEYQDFQQSFTDSNTFQSVTVTVGDSSITGFEAMLTYNFDNDLSVTASLGLLDAKFADNASDGGVFEYGGNQFRLAPEVSTSLNVNKLFYVDDWEIDTNLLVTYQSEVFFESSNYPGMSQDAYALTNASVKFSKGNSKFAYEIYAENLFDEEYLIDAGNTGGGIGIPTYVRGMPLIWGVRAYYAF